MATIIGLPKLSPTMEEGVLARWTKKEGERVAPGEVIAEVETDKATMDFALEEEGTLLKLLASEGDTVKLGAAVAILGEPGEDIQPLLAEVQEPARELAREPAAPAPEPPAPQQPSTPEPSPRHDSRVLASPLAKTLAVEHGIDLRTLRGSGPGGRVVERDVRAAIEDKAEAAPAAAPAPEAEFVDRTLTPMRRTIARRLTEAKQTIPHFYLTADCDAAPLASFRTALGQLLGKGEKVTVNDLVVKAAALALRRVPEVNASFLGDRIRAHGRVHVGVAVTVEDGLITAVVRDADRKGLATIAVEVRDLAARARARRLAPEEMTGSTFTVSNLGMYGIDHFEAIINPPEAVVLAVGAMRKQAVVGQDNQVVAGLRMTLTLSCDHRVVDGALGARFMSELVNILESPAALAL